MQHLTRVKSGTFPHEIAVEAVAAVVFPSSKDGKVPLTACVIKIVFLGTFR